MLIETQNPPQPIPITPEENPITPEENPITPEENPITIPASTPPQKTQPPRKKALTQKIFNSCLGTLIGGFIGSQIPPFMKRYQKTALIKIIAIWDTYKDTFFQEAKSSKLFLKKSKKRFPKACNVLKPDLCYQETEQSQQALMDCWKNQLDFLEKSFECITYRYSDKKILYDQIYNGCVKDIGEALSSKFHFHLFRKTFSDFTFERPSTEKSIQFLAAGAIVGFACGYTITRIAHWIQKKKQSQQKETNDRTLIYNTLGSTFLYSCYSSRNTSSTRTTCSRTTPSLHSPELLFSSS